MKGKKAEQEFAHMTSTFGVLFPVSISTGFKNNLTADDNKLI